MKSLELVALTFRGSLHSRKRNGTLPRSPEKSSSLSLVCLFHFSPSPFEKAPHVSAFFTGALLRSTDGLYPLLVCHSNLRHKDKSRFEVSLFSIYVLLSLSLFFFFFFFSPLSFVSKRELSNSFAVET